MRLVNADQRFALGAVLARLEVDRLRLQMLQVLHLLLDLLLDVRQVSVGVREWLLLVLYLEGLEARHELLPKLRLLIRTILSCLLVSCIASILPSLRPRWRPRDVTKLIGCWSVVLFFADAAGDRTRAFAVVALDVIRLSLHSGVIILIRIWFIILELSSEVVS